MVNTRKSRAIHIHGRDGDSTLIIEGGDRVGGGG